MPNPVTKCTKNPAQQATLFVAPGHYYSPLPDVDEVRTNETAIFGNGTSARTIPGIDLREADQLELLKKLAGYYGELPFPARPTPGFRYYFENDWYSYSDAIFLYCTIRHFRPQRIVEVGGGFSSCVMLDTNDRFFDGRIECTFIDPDPGRLLENIGSGDRERTRIISKPVQNVEPGLFTQLDQGDILFVDSSHVTKTGSDVNHVLFQILPSLKPGVLVHFHDVFYPFEYPRSWVYQGRAWNEAYLLRAFLQYNATFRIVLFNTFLETFHESFFRREMPLCLKNRGGSLWLQKVA